MAKVPERPALSGVAQLYPFFSLNTFFFSSSVSLRVGASTHEIERFLVEIPLLHQLWKYGLQYSVKNIYYPEL